MICYFCNVQSTCAWDITKHSDLSQEFFRNHQCKNRMNNTSRNILLHIEMIFFHGFETFLYIEIEYRLNE